MTEADPSEKRRNPRVRIAWQGLAICSDKKAYVIRTDKLSVDGGLFFCHKAMRKGEVVLLRLNPLVNGKPIILQAVIRVVHSYLLPSDQGFGVGFAFTRVPKSLLALINQRLDGC